MINAGNPDDVTENDSSSFKYKSRFLKGLTIRDVAGNINPDISAAHRLFTNAKVVVLQKYLSSFFRSLEMPLINWKIPTTIQITSTKLYVAVATLPTKEIIKLTKQLEKKFKRSIYWNEYNSKIETQESENNNVKIIVTIRCITSRSKLTVFSCFNNAETDANRVERNNHRKY